MGSYHASIQEKLVQIIDEASAPMALQDIFNRMEAKIIEENGSFNAHDLALTEQHTDPRWKVRTRSMIANMAAAGNLVARVSRGVYAPLSLAPEDLADDSEDNEDSAGQAGWVYAFSLPMSSGLLKIGRTIDLEKRMQQHRLQHAKAHLPDSPYLEAAWRVSDAEAAEEAVHGLLKLRSKHYRGTGSGREWFKATIQDVQEMLDIAFGTQVPRDQLGVINILD
ncbi:GIY-YIG nuclease family protein [Sulfitobacter pontiacus]|jgi:predicted GIY-YIG superfamily endonuclease|uniref:GIY-YIG nuclease family protein n=1 Tax=Sulfitobacter pontiacus TaxID=60137 RepID=UPI000C59EB49|nr:GIY-YIG nuclease family protein [Sulfitobacter pontiacus]MAN10760.1 hypothetical protein [Roseobacter sp.]HBU55261.1 hypothetical protein [Sulfitobacter sp.]HJO49276.1 GIY-YIG nuclease family protein [Sulfitobacter pontiacus]|tara:strand:- start:227 stop:895 length:669 start_codon:yes stop_codon:yes gene_type:complete